MWYDRRVNPAPAPRLPDGPSPTGALTANAAVEQMVEQWALERPDLPADGLDAMETLALFSRFAGIATRRIDATFSGHGLNVGEFDVLASLRRSGEPFQLSPSALVRQLVLSSSAMTNRLDRLEERGLVRRSPDPDDRRALVVSLTEHGRRLVDSAVSDHVLAEDALLRGLTDAERRRLTAMLRKLLAALE